MIEKDIPGFPGLVLAVSRIEHGSMPKAAGQSQKKLANREEFAGFLGFDAGGVCQAKLVHGAGVGFVTPDSGKVLKADILITDVPGRLLAVAVADCPTVFLWTRSKRAVCLIHAGWRGLVKEQVVSQGVEMFCFAYSLRKSEISALLGPGIGKCCFQVQNDEDGLTNFVNWPTFIFGSNGQHFVDLIGIAKEQLYRSGVRIVSNTGECTCCSPAGYFSFRREKNSLRGLAVAGFLES
ncbi:laccase domain-containing protein [Candidatus Giovannonibacteria bacterium]|nr:laccase domain-containing protein [Candidatus Giovannonibacteria bacterium]